MVNTTNAVDEVNNRPDATTDAAHDRLLLQRSIKQIEDVSGDIGSLQKRHKEFQDMLRVDLQKEKANAENDARRQRKTPA